MPDKPESKTPITKSKAYTLFDKEGVPWNVVPEHTAVVLETQLNEARSDLQECLEWLYELKGERHWHKDEPRCEYKAEFEKLCELIEKLENGQNNER